jgi:hypothetical protein
MSGHRLGRQGDLFETAATEPPPAEFVARIRDELYGTLARTRDATTLPWRDLTAATLAELRFHSIASWLPSNEAAALRADFQREMGRLYAVAEETFISNRASEVRRATAGSRSSAPGSAGDGCS